MEKKSHHVGMFFIVAIFIFMILALIFISQYLTPGFLKGELTSDPAQEKCQKECGAYLRGSPGFNDCVNDCVASEASLN